MIINLIVLLPVFCLTGCGSAVLRSDAAARYGNLELREPATVRVVVTDEARRKRHFAKTLRIPDIQDFIEQRLAVDGLFAGEATEMVPRVVVEITEARMRADWAAIVFGAMAGTDRIHARVMLFDANDRKVNHFNVMTSYAWGGYVGGLRSVRLPWVYEKFAEDVVGALTGTEKVKLVKYRERKPLRRLLPP